MGLGLECFTKAHSLGGGLTLDHGNFANLKDRGICLHPHTRKSWERHGPETKFWGKKVFGIFFFLNISFLLFLTRLVGYCEVISWASKKPRTANWVSIAPYRSLGCWKRSVGTFLMLWSLLSWCHYVSAVVRLQKKAQRSGDYGYICGSSQCSRYTGPIVHPLSSWGDPSILSWNGTQDGQRESPRNHFKTFAQE